MSSAYYAYFYDAEWTCCIDKAKNSMKRHFMKKSGMNVAEVNESTMSRKP